MNVCSEHMHKEDRSRAVEINEEGEGAEGRGKVGRMLHLQANKTQHGRPTAAPMHTSSVLTG